MHIRTLQHLSRFTFFDLNTLGQATRTMPDINTFNFEPLFVLDRDTSNQASFDQCGIPDIDSFTFCVTEDDQLAAVLFQNKTLGLVQFEQLPSGTYQLFMNCKQRIYNHYFENKLIDSSFVLSFKFTVFANLLQNRLLLNLLTLNNTNSINTVIEKYYQLWGNSAVEGS